MRYFLGMDGGGTRTVAWMADEHGRIVARASTGPSNPFKVGFEICQRELLKAARTATRLARSQVEVSTPPGRLAGGVRQAGWPVLEAVCVGLAGVDRPVIYQTLLRWLRRSIRARFYLLTSDAAIALEAATGDSPGIVVISGTGSIALARDARGNLLRAGGWGNLFDDVGSGYDLGRKAIMAALQDFDGRGPHTILSSRICRALGIRNITEVVQRQLTPSEIAALFPVVADAARKRDRVARKLCDEAGRQLASMVFTLLKQLRPRRGISVFCTGGVFSSNARILKEFTRHLQRRAPDVRVQLLRRAPVEGALGLARKIANSKA